MIYKIINTANQPLLITPLATTSSGITAIWEQQSLVIPIGVTSPITLTIPNIVNSGTISISFTPSSAS